MFSRGMFAAFPVSIAVRRRAFPAGSPPPWRAATVISLMSLVKWAPRRESVTAFLRLICFHLLWPATTHLRRLPGIYFPRGTPATSALDRQEPRGEVSRRED